MQRHIWASVNTKKQSRITLRTPCKKKIAKNNPRTRVHPVKLYAGEDMQYLWVISSVPVSHILSTREDMQYLWVNLYEWRMNETSLMNTAYPHRYCIPSRVLRIWLTGIAYPHRYWGYDSRLLMIWLTGTAYPHRYWGYDSRVLMIWLTGTAYPHRYWGYDSRVLHILRGTEDMTHGYWGYDSQVLMTWLTGNAYPHGYCI